MPPVDLRHRERVAAAKDGQTFLEGLFRGEAPGLLGGLQEQATGVRFGALTQPLLLSAALRAQALELGAELRDEAGAVVSLEFPREWLWVAYSAP